MEKILHKTNKTFLLRYSFLAVPLAFIGLPLYVNLPKYYAENYGVSLSSIGIILLLLRVGDAVIDPLIGHISDNHARLRRKIIAISALCVTLFFAMLFLLPTTPSPLIPKLWFAANTALTYFFFSIVYINYYGLGLSITDDYDKRTKVSAFREAGTLIGVLIAAILPKALASIVAPQKVFLVYALIFGLLFLFSILLLPKIETPPSIKQERRFSLSEIIRIPKMKWLLTLFFINGLPTSITSTLFLFYVSDALKAEASSGYFLFIYFIAAAISTQIWPLISARIGKRKSLFIAMLLTIISFIWVITLTPDNANLFYYICILTGFALGADMVLLPSILADVMENHKDKNSSVFGLWQALSKTNLALAAGFALPLLSFMGYQPGKIITTSVGWNLSFAYAVIPCIIKIGALVILLISPIDKTLKSK